jgi:hypothetical protein
MCYDEIMKKGFRPVTLAQAARAAVGMPHVTAFEPDFTASSRGEDQILEDAEQSVGEEVGHGFRDVAKQLSARIAVEGRLRLSVRALLKEFGKARRGKAVNVRIAKSLLREGITVSRTLDSADMDDVITLKQLEKKEKPASPGKAARKETVGKIVIQKAKPLRGRKSILWRLLAADYDCYRALLNLLTESNRIPVRVHGLNRRAGERLKFPYQVVINGPLKGDDHLYLVGVSRKASEAAKKRGVPSTGSALPLDELVESMREVVEHSELRTADSLKAMASEMRSELGSAIEELKLDLEKIRHDSIRQLAVALNNDGLGSLIEEQHAEHQEEVRKLRAQIEQLIGHLAAAHEEIETLEGIDDGADLDQGYEPRALENLGDVLDVFSVLCDGEAVEILASARKSAAKSSSQKCGEVLALLVTLRELAQCLFSLGTDTGDLRSWFQKRGYEYAANESSSTMNQFGGQREFKVAGKPIRFENHVTLFPGAADCTQVYFYRDTKRNKLVIGYVGRHLATSSGF